MWYSFILISHSLLSFSLHCRFIEIIRQRGNTLFELLREVCNNKQEQLDKKNEVLLHLGSQADHCITVMEAILATSSDMALLYSKKLVSNVLVCVTVSQNAILYFNLKI